MKNGHEGAVCEENPRILRDCPMLAAATRHRTGGPETQPSSVPCADSRRVCFSRCCVHFLATL